MNKTTHSVMDTMTQVRQNPHTSFEYWIMLGNIFNDPSQSHNAAESFT